MRIGTVIIYFVIAAVVSLVSEMFIYSLSVLSTYSDDDSNYMSCIVNGIIIAILITILIIR